MVIITRGHAPTANTGVLRPPQVREGMEMLRSPEACSGLKGGIRFVMFLKCRKLPLSAHVCDVNTTSFTQIESKKSM